MMKILNLKLVILLEYKKYKKAISLLKEHAKDYAPNLSKETFVIEKVRNTVPWTFIISNRNDEKTVGILYNCKKQIKKILVLKK